MATNGAPVHYTLLTTRGVAWPLAIVAGALAALPFFSGLPVPTGSRAPAVQPTPGTQRLSQEVQVPNAARGCRWQHSADPAVQIADCGDESESVRVVFQNGRATEYRVTAVQAPNRLPPSGQSGVAGAVSVLPRNPASNSAPLRVTPNAGG